MNTLHFPSGVVISITNCYILTLLYLSRISQTLVQRFLYSILVLLQVLVLVHMRYI